MSEDISVGTCRESDLPELQGVGGSQGILWTEDNVCRLIELVLAKKSSRDIADLMGISKNAVIGKVHRLQAAGVNIKLYAPRFGLWTESDVATLRELWAKGISPTIIGQKLNRTQKQVSSKACDLHLSREMPEEPFVFGVRSDPEEQVPPSGNGCQWIEGDPAIDPTPCGSKVVWHIPSAKYPHGKRSVYCDQHHGRCYDRVVNGRREGQAEFMVSR